MPNSKHAFWILLFALVATIVAYSSGLNGPFMLDDSVHITQNRWVKIESLDWASLERAWNSSFSAFPNNRPLAQLSFGINHALAGLEPWAFKATNLAIHLLTGLLVFVFSRLAYRAVTGAADDDPQGRLMAAAVAALWLLNPLHVSTVLYTVQRMAQLSSLFLLAALSCYFWGRLQLARGHHGVGWMLAAAPLALLGFFGKENAVLLPLLLLVSELTLLRGVPLAGQRIAVRSVWLLYIALPLIAGLVYFLTHPGLLTFDGRPFTLEERVLTQPRVLWLYLKWLYIPNLAEFGLFHDDLRPSSGLLDPPTTLAAIIGLLGLAVAAFVYRRRSPFFAFAVLFFLAGHALESSVLPLELVFEHRNYLAGLGPLLFLGYLVTVASVRMNVRPLALGIGGMLLISYGAVTWLRADNWSSYKSFILSTAQHHPDSPRSNFMAAQLLINALDKSGDDAPALADAARTFLGNGLAADERCINCLFGFVVLDLHLGRKPDPAVLRQLRDSLRAGYVGATKVSVSQFSFLVKWQQSGSPGLSPRELEAIFDAALENPLWSHTGRAGIEAAYREYFEFVAKDLEAALAHARAAVTAWPQQWSYHMHLVRVLEKLGRIEEAQAALDIAAALAANESQQQQTNETRVSLQRQAAPLTEATVK